MEEKKQVVDRALGGFVDECHMAKEVLRSCYAHARVAFLLSNNCTPTIFDTSKCAYKISFEDCDEALRLSIDKVEAGEKGAEIVALAYLNDLYDLQFALRLESPAGGDYLLSAKGTDGSGESPFFALEVSHILGVQTQSYLDRVLDKKVGQLNKGSAGVWKTGFAVVVVFSGLRHDASALIATKTVEKSK